MPSVFKSTPKIDAKFTEWKDSEIHHIKNIKSGSEDNTLDKDDSDDDDN